MVSSLVLMVEEFGAEEVSVTFPHEFFDIANKLLWGAVAVRFADENTVRIAAERYGLEKVFELARALRANFTKGDAAAESASLSMVGDSSFAGLVEVENSAAEADLERRQPAGSFGNKPQP